MNMFKLFPTHEFIPYFIIGGVTTLIDWGLFWFTTYLLEWHYELALLCSAGMAGLFHYTTNKFITFNCQSPHITIQYILYVTLSIFCLLINMLLLYVLINYVQCSKMFARMILTLIMLLPNFLLHKHITFNKYFFSSPEYRG